MKSTLSPPPARDKAVSRLHPIAALKASPPTPQRSEYDLGEQLSEALGELRTWRAALDHVESGILILDQQLCVVYANPVLHRIMNADPSQFGEHPHYEELLRAALRSSAVDMDDYVAKRLAWVRSGFAEPMDLKMSTGAVIRCHLAALPEGGRMLIYSDVTDLVSKAVELERLAATDPMTGACNRRRFFAAAQIEWERASRYDRALSMLMLDIDHFKSINDFHGHLIGDEVIMRVSDICASSKRDCDVFGRIGGEEFALLLPSTGVESAHPIAEDLRNAVGAHPLSIGDQAIPATVSIGIAVRSNSMTDFLHLFSEADRALYQAKHMGRNRVAVGALDHSPRPATAAALCQDEEIWSRADL